MEGLIRRESLGVGGDAPQDLGATQSYSEVPEVKYNKNCTSKTTSSSSGLAHFLFFTFRPFFFIAALFVLKHSTTSFTGTGGFVNICTTLAVVIDT